MDSHTTHPKHVVALEGYLSDDAEHRLSMGPLLEFLKLRDKTRYVTLTSASVEEFRFSLEVAKTVRKGGILFLSFHGFRGGIHLTTQKVTMEEISSWLGPKFGKRKNWIIFFHSCTTVNIPKERIQEFMANTGIQAVIGFKRRVDFVDAAAIDLLLLDWLQFYVNVPRLWSRFRRLYKDLVKITGLEVYHNGHRT